MVSSAKHRYSHDPIIRGKKATYLVDDWKLALGVKEVRGYFYVLQK